jgi:hypothetical protein
MATPWSVKAAGGAMSLRLDDVAICDIISEPGEAATNRERTAAHSVGVNRNMKSGGSARDCASLPDSALQW